MKQKHKLELIYDMTSHPGWQELVKDLSDRVDALKEGMISNESTPYQIGLAQGHVKVYREIMNLRQLLDMVMKQQQEDEIEDEQAAVEAG